MRILEEGECDVAAVSHVLAMSHVVAVGSANSLWHCQQFGGSQVTSISIYRALSSRREYSLFLSKKALLHIHH